MMIILTSVKHDSDKNSMRFQQRTEKGDVRIVKDGRCLLFIAQDCFHDRQNDALRYDPREQ